MSKEVFLKLFHMATSEENHDFFYYDMEEKNEAWKVRKNFDIALVVPKEESDASILEEK